MTWWLQHGPLGLFVFAFGACVGSFLNVVIFRLPERMSVITPPSRCPACGTRLHFFKDNLPILGYLFVGGQCRYCRVRLSPQYVIIELLVAILFLYLYLALYAGVGWLPGWLAIGGPWWEINGLFGNWGLGSIGTFPAFIALTFMLSGLIAMTVIDARTFEIPLQIPIFVTVTAFVAWPLQALLPLRATPQMTWPLAGLDWTATGVAFGGMLGVLISWRLLCAGVLKPSFADYEDYMRPDETFAQYPHGRREMVREIAYLCPCIALGILGGFIGSRVAAATAPPALVQAIAVSFMGYLVGGGLVWGIRILGTLAFGREAMGLGDVHLLAAVGAVLGWWDPILIFFLAPFSGLGWAVMSKGLAAVFKGIRRELPYGPHLAVATLVLVLLRPGIASVWNHWFVVLPFPEPGFAP